MRKTVKDIFFVTNEETGELWVKAAGICPVSLAHSGLIPIRYCDELPGEPLMSADNLIWLLQSGLVFKGSAGSIKRAIEMLRQKIAETVKESSNNAQH